MKMRNHPAPPMPPSDGKKWLKTLVGTKLIEGDPIAKVKVGSGYVRKPVSELSPGEEIFCRTDGVAELSIRDIEAGLAKLPWYRARRATLFDEGGNPVFLAELLRGMEGKQELWPRQIADRAKIAASYNGGKQVPLSFEQAECAARFIHERLVSFNVQKPVTPEHVLYGWLGGMVICPMNVEQVVKALVEVASGLSKLLQMSFQNDYWLYRGDQIIGIRAVLASMRGGDMANHKNGSCQKNLCKHNYKRDPAEREATRAAMVEHFANRITPHYYTTRVVQVSDKPPASHAPAAFREKNGVSAPAAHAGNHFRLFSGIELEQIDEAGVHEMTPAEQGSLFNAVVDATKAVTLAFMRSRNNLVPDEVRKGSEEMNNFFIFTLFNLRLKLGHKDDTNKEIRKKLDSLRISYRDSFAVEDEVPRTSGPKWMPMPTFLAEAILTDALDREWKLRPGTLRRLFELEFKLHRTIPTDVFYAIALNNLILAKERIAKRVLKDKGTIISTREEGRARDALLRNRQVGTIYGEIMQRRPLSQIQQVLSENGLGALAENKAWFEETMGRSQRVFHGEEEAHL